MEYWKLEVVDDGGHTYSVIGTEEAMNIFYEEIKHALEAVDGTAPKIIEVHGMFDSADRAPIKWLFVVENINTVMLVKMY